METHCTICNFKSMFWVTPLQSIAPYFQENHEIRLNFFRHTKFFFDKFFNKITNDPSYFTSYFTCLTHFRCRRNFVMYSLCWVPRIFIISLIFFLLHKTIIRHYTYTIKYYVIPTYVSADINPQTYHYLNMYFIIGQIF